MVAANPPEHLVLPDPAAVRQKIQSLDAEAARLRRLYRALLRVVESPASPPPVIASDGRPARQEGDTRAA